MKQRMTDDQLRAIASSEMRLAIGYWSGKLAFQRQKAMAYYLGEPILDLTPPEIEGRSSVVSPDVRNTIESMLPQLMVKFSGSDNVVEFEATKPGDEPKAEQATDYINYLYHVKNHGEGITYRWMKDALLSKNGIVKVWWDNRHEETREEYRGLSDVELAQVMDDPEIEITEQKSYPDEDDAKQREEAIQQLTQQLQQASQAAQQNPQAAQAAQQIQAQIQAIQAKPPAMLFDIVCQRTKTGGKVCVENVPPEEFLISRKAKSIAEAAFVGHRVMRTMSELRSMGYENIDNISSDDQGTAFNLERIERLSYDDELAYIQADAQDNMDESQRIVWVTECYIRVDYDGDGITELRKVVMAGNQILENEICDVAPFVSITPVPMPHKFFGLSVADLALEGQKINTSILRGMLDNMYLQINGRYYAVDGQVNLDDLLTSRPGGVVRTKNPQAVGRLDQGLGDTAFGFNMLEYMKGFQEDSTGWTRYNQGTDGDSLNQTATGVNLVTNRADMRLDLIARNFAEGFRELFRMMLKLVANYQQKPAITKLRGQWVPVDPREWRNGFECVINVGLGTGNKDQRVAHMNMLLQQQQLGLQVGDTTPQNVYEAHKELVKALGFKSADKFFTDPSQMPPRPDPAQMQMQHEMQLEQMKAQIKAQTDQATKAAELQTEQQRMAMQAQVDTHRQEVEAQQQQARAQMEMALDKAKADQQAQLEQMKAQFQAQTAIEIAKINAEAKVKAAELQASQTPSTLTPEQEMAADDEDGDSDNSVPGMLRQLIALQRRPKRALRGPDGRVVGAVPASDDELMIDPNTGKVIGLQ